MPNNIDYLIELIFKKLKNNKSITINLKKNELAEFIKFLIRDKR
tara:strand:+ start:383 stop:514 length:132 start_codon:yes stop_codon:yes gene_type:complete